MVAGRETTSQAARAPFRDVALGGRADDRQVSPRIRGRADDAERRIAELERQLRER